MAKLLPGIVLGRRLRLHSEWVVYAAWLLLLLALEIAGRLTASEFSDAFAITVLLVAARFTTRRHRQRALGAVDFLRRLAARMAALARRLYLHIGIDFRGTPPVPAGIPPLFAALTALLCAVTLLLILSRGTILVAVLSFLRPRCYTLYLAALGAVWFALLAGTLLALLTPIMLIHDEFVLSARGQQRRSLRGEIMCISAYLLGVLAAGLALPAWLPAALCGMVLILGVMVLYWPGNPQLNLLWRSPAGVAPLRSLGWRRFALLQALTITGLSLALVAVISWPRMWAAGHGPGATALPASSILGLAYGWAYTGALAATSVSLSKLVFRARRRDPATPQRPTLLVWNCLSAVRRRRVRAVCRRRGWQVRFGSAAAAGTEVQIRLVEPHLTADPDDMPGRWPLPVRITELNRPELWRRLSRRDEIQTRRRLLRGLETLFKRAARRRFQHGHGFIIGLHYWFISGLFRDEDETEMEHEDQTFSGEVIGPAYHRLLDPGARHHFYRIMRASDLDLIFIQDGLQFQQWRRVLRILFELYDVYGGCRRAEQRDFTGIPGVRVMIHDHDDAEPLIRTEFVEPQYQQIARARIMEIFRDRGGQREHPEVPVEADWAPVGAL